MGFLVTAITANPTVDLLEPTLSHAPKRAFEQAFCGSVVGLRFDRAAIGKNCVEIGKLCDLTNGVGRVDVHKLVFALPERWNSVQDAAFRLALVVKYLIKGYGNACDFPNAVKTLDRVTSLFSIES